MRVKLTDKDGRTYGGMLWGEGVHHAATGTPNAIGTDGYIHYYDNPLIAVFINPIHGDFDPATMLLWEFVPDEGTAEKRGECGSQRGVRAGTTTHLMPVPQITIAQRVRATILIARKVFGGKSLAWDNWAEGWLARRDRSATLAAEVLRVALAAEAKRVTGAARAWRDEWAERIAAGAVRAALATKPADVIVITAAVLWVALVAEGESAGLVALIEQAIREET